MRYSVNELCITRTIAGVSDAESLEEIRLETVMDLLPEVS